MSTGGPAGTPEATLDAGCGARRRRTLLPPPDRPGLALVSPGRLWKPSAERPSHVASGPGALVLGLGASATLSRVVGPRGDLRTVGDPAVHLIDVDVVTWFRRACVEHRARLKVTAGAAGRIDLLRIRYIGPRE